MASRCGREAGNESEANEPMHASGMVSSNKRQGQCNLGLTKGSAVRLLVRSPLIPMRLPLSQSPVEAEIPGAGGGWLHADAK